MSPVFSFRSVSSVYIGVRLLFTAGGNMAGAESAWPDLEWSAWKDTAYGLHMAAQIVGKTRMALTPLRNHWWNVPLYVSARGLTTSPMPWRGGVLEIECDFQVHMVELRLSNGEVRRVELGARPVADFYADYMAGLNALGVEVNIWPMPVEVADPIRFNLDTAERPYERAAVERFHQTLMRVDTLLRQFSTGFQGKISPVHFFWGAMDLCVTRFSGRVASGPPRPDPMQQEAYSHEVISAGWWPGNGGYGQPAFYCYAAPVPDGLSAKPIHPGAWDAALGEFLLNYNDTLAAASPGDEVMNFLESTYAACADAAKWDRKALERPMSQARCR
jgi:hypothetical protein